MKELRWWYINSSIGGIGQAHGTVYGHEMRDRLLHPPRGDLQRLFLPGRRKSIHEGTAFKPQAKLSR